MEFARGTLQATDNKDHGTFKFFKRMQKPSESVVEFMSELRNWQNRVILASI